MRRCHDYLGKHLISARQHAEARTGVRDRGDYSRNIALDGQWVPGLYEEENGWLGDC